MGTQGFKSKTRGNWVAQEVGHQTLGFFAQVIISRLGGMEPRVRLCRDNVEPA